jgi:hypothetical protein
MTTRRKLLTAIGTGLVVLPFSGRAQKTSRISHIDYLSAGTLETNHVFLGALRDRDGSRELGYIEGENIGIDVRWAGDAAYLFPQFAASMVQGEPSAIVTTCIPSTRAAKGATGLFLWSCRSTATQWRPGSSQASPGRGQCHWRMGAVRRVDREVARAAAHRRPQSSRCSHPLQSR